MERQQKMNGSQGGNQNGHVNGHNKEQSDLFKIEVNSDDPFDLFKEWYQQAEDAGVIMPQAFNLATSDGSGRVSSRTLLMRKLDEDGFLLMTDKRSKKSFDIAKCPRVALTFLWMYPRETKGVYAQQVRVEGIISELPFEEHLDLYSTEPLFCKIRGSICRQGEVVNWHELKETHDKVYKQCLENGIPEKMNNPPDHYVLYKVVPEMIDFYMATEATIGDRIVFRMSDQPSLIPEKVLKKSTIIDDTKDKKNGIEELERTFRNGLKIATGPGQNIVGNIPKEWIHYRICA